MFWDERVFVPAQAGLGPELCRSSSQRRSPNKQAGGVGEAAGGFTSRDVFRWVLGFDKAFWVRTLNPTNTFTFSTQIFHTHIFDYDSSIKTGVINPGTNAFVPRKEDEFVTTFLLNTLLWRGRLQPSVFGSYDPRGVHIGRAGHHLAGRHAPAPHRQVRDHARQLRESRILPRSRRSLLRAEVSL